MKKFFYSFLVLTLLFSCKKEEESSSCAKSDFVGTYTGIYKCDTEESETLEYKIVERGGALFLVAGVDDEYELNATGCDFEIPETDVFFVTESGDGKLNGKEITINFKVSIIGIPLNCTYVGKKM